MEKTEIQQRLISNHVVFTDFIKSLTDIVARHSMPGKWTPVQQLDHIVKSVAPVKIAFALPKFVLIFLGKANRPSRSYEELVARYKAKLAAGGKSTARYLPSSRCERSDLVDTVHRHVQALCKRLDRFSENELDRFILPHPLLGKVTLREMLYFTIYHVEHHHLQVNPHYGKTAA